jgi:hypothetical protein
MEKLELIINNNYWIATENYGVLKAIYKEAGGDNRKIGYFQCNLVDGYMILNNGIRGYKDRGELDEVAPKTPELHATKEEWEALGWKK